MAAEREFVGIRYRPWEANNPARYPCLAFVTERLNDLERAWVNYPLVWVVRNSMHREFLHSTEDTD